MSKIRDLYVPEVFNKYFIEESTKVNNLIKSGIVQPDASLNVLAEKGGKSINLPFFNTLDGSDEVLGLDKELNPATVSAGMDSCSLLMRGRAWKVADLEKSLTGEDVMGAVTSQVGEYWAGREQAILLKMLEGVFGSDTMKDNVYEAKAEGASKAKSGEIGVITAREFIKAKNKMGDNSKKLTAVMMHSDTFAELEAQNLIQYIPNSEGVVEFPTYLNKKVIVDDDCPVTREGVYTTYLFGAGAIARGEGKPETPSEIGRNHLSGVDELVTRRHMILHPRGVKFKADGISGEAPTNEDLAKAENWERVYNPKNIRIVAFKHKI